MGAAAGLTSKQQPGPDNPLGFVKLNFNNSHSVYLHDPPSRSLFGRNFRAARSGCARVHGIEQRAAWVLAEQGWKEEHIKHMQERGSAQTCGSRRPCRSISRLGPPGRGQTASCSSAATFTRRTVLARPPGTY
jgi:L,D-transpeptidase catalytic domain